MQLGKTEGSMVLQAHMGLYCHGLCYLSFCVFVSGTMTCENIDLRDNLLHLGFESSRSHIGFKTTVSVAVILPDNLTFCVV